ncbi:Protein CBR-UNC-120 [Caenorhabditis briggsae]|uniref:Serum response factor homolog n=3 Tax=Caenorhabditis briggsae TaxID=6238 RepID=A8XG03_CAEBR|nr:Protein CBR-UNC-120 [Caenorhabditis briggsae]ULU12645.1 hypothetical protein L3Y34_015711 [Caenorhabditis briggsae]CAP31508.1 Protein CBR-UNC-120 [Caenorhabditis briggsae]
MTDVEDFAQLLQKLQNSSPALPEGTSSTPTPSSSTGLLPNGKKTKGRVKIKMEYINNKLRRYTTFSKRKTGIMKKAFELSTLTGTQVMLLVASETGHVYTYATKKLQPMISSEPGKAMIQSCLNAPGDEGSDVQPSRTEFTFDSGNGGNGMRKRKMLNDAMSAESSNNSPSMGGFSPFLPSMAPLFSSFGEDDYNNTESGDDSDSEEAASDIKEEDQGSPTMIKQEMIETDSVTASLQQTIKEAMKQAASNRQALKKTKVSSSPTNQKFINPFLLQGGANAANFLAAAAKQGDDATNHFLSQLNFQQLIESAGLASLSE